MKTPAERYAEEMGKDPPDLPDDDPLRWQYDYRGTKKEKAELESTLDWLGDDTKEIEGQDSLLAQGGTMTGTIHQCVHGYWWHWDTGPDLPWNLFRQDGLRVVKVQLQDDGPLDPDVPKMLKAAGLQCWGMVWPAGGPLNSTGATWTPEQCAEFFKDEKDRMLAAGTNLYGADFNFELPIRDADNSSVPRGEWSRRFIKRFRELCPTLPAHLDTVFGDFAGGIENVYTPGMPMAIQTFWGNEGLYDDPLPVSPGTESGGIMHWTAGANPIIPKRVVKPIIRVSPNNAGHLPDFLRIMADCVRVGTKGIGLYYMDGGDVGQMRSLIKEAIRRGVAYR